MGHWNGTMIGLSVEAKDKKIAKQLLQCLDVEIGGEFYEEIGVLDYREFNPLISGTLEEDQLLENEIEFWHGDNDYSDEYGYDDEEYEEDDEYEDDNEEEDDEDDEDDESEESFQIDDLYHLANKLFAPAYVYMAHEDGNSIDDSFFRYEAILDPQKRTKSEMCCFYSYGDGINVGVDDPKEEGTEKREDSIAEKELSTDAIDALIEKATSMRFKELASKLKGISDELNKSSGADLLQIDNKLYKVKNSKLLKYKGKESVVTIPDGVISIEKEAFYGLETLEEVIIPDGVTTIKTYAFGQCSELKKVSLPDSLTTLGDSVFYGCANLTEITIPKGIRKIGSETFAGLEKLEEIIIPEGISELKSFEFSGCTELKKVVLPKSLTSIEDGAFNDCENLIDIVIPESVTYLGENAFSGCKQLESITIPEQVTKIERSLFSECYNLSEIHLPHKITDIGERAFSGCKKLAEFDWPKHVTVIKDSVFGWSGLASFTIPDGITRIGQYALMSCNLTEITIPDSVTEIDESSFAANKNLIVTVTKGSYAEKYCKQCKLMKKIIEKLPCNEFAQLFKITSQYFNERDYHGRVLNNLVFYPTYKGVEPGTDAFAAGLSTLNEGLKWLTGSSLNEEEYESAIARINELRKEAESDVIEVEDDPTKLRYILNKSE